MTPEVAASSPVEGGGEAVDDRLVVGHERLVAGDAHDHRAVVAVDREAHRLVARNAAQPTIASTLLPARYTCIGGPGTIRERLDPVHPPLDHGQHPEGIRLIRRQLELNEGELVADATSIARLNGSLSVVPMNDTALCAVSVACPAALAAPDRTRSAIGLPGGWGCAACCSMPGPGT
ncbi:MAG: hypothetical protein WAO15_25855 [Mycobacterium sp.]